MAELVAGAFLSSSLQCLFERLGSGEVLEYLRGKSKRSDFDELVGRLKIVLNSVLAVIEDAEQKQTLSKRVEAWMDMLQEAVFDAEDLLDVIETDALQLKVKAELSIGKGKPHNFLKRKKKLRNVFSGSHSSDHGDMESKVKKLLERLEYIATQKDFLGLKLNMVREKPSWRLPSTSLVEESEVYGRDFDKGEIIKLLLLDNVGSRKICVIPIVGMGGVGKTTLAQAVFNDQNVRERFELKAWVCVSEELDVYRVTKTLLQSVSSSSPGEAMDLNSLQVALKESLTGKKFLIVLDDVWCEKSADLSVMCMPFKDGSRGSKIVITTRSEKCASIMGTVRSYHLKELSDEACWQLFANEASGINGDFTACKDVERIGREIVKKCKGLPLALKTLGGLLRSTLDVGEWKRILESDIWDLKEDESNILPALKLSYHYLPSQLKRCFAYCSIFPKDYEFQKKELIFLWMAVNLLEHPSRDRRIEEVGDEYFLVLVSRSFFQHSSTREYSVSKEPTNKSFFVMHGLIHDLAKSVSAEYCLHLEDAWSSDINVKKTRHLAYIAAFRDPYKRVNNILQATNLRTFLPLSSINEYNYISTKVLHDLFMTLRHLRVLSLSGYGNVNHLPYSVGGLRHLRYLDLSRTKILELPESICSLFNLQTLKLNCCWNLKKLPKDMHHLVNLQYLDLRSCNRLVEMPRQLSKLKSLEMLSIFIVGKDSGTKIGELRQLSDIRGDLFIKNLENVGNAMDELDQARLMDKKHLETLQLEWSEHINSDAEHARDVLDMLLPNKTLKKLHIYGYPAKNFPNWVGSDSLGNIVCITLSRCRNCLSLPPLGQLPSLVILQISDLSALVTVGPEFYGNCSGVKPFPSLEILKFSRMSSWETWLHEDSCVFAELIELEISSCRKLIGDLPSFLPSLTKLKISNCKELVSSLPRMPRVLELVLRGCENMLQVELFIEALKQMESCQCISVAFCSSLIPIQIGYLPTTLKTLNIQKCAGLEFQLDRPHQSLEVLKIWRSCDTLLSLPLDSFSKLKELEIHDSKSLESLSMSDGLCRDLISLSSLLIVDCPNFVSFPKGGLPSPNLAKLEILRCEKLKLLPEKMQNLLSSLTRLKICNCPGIESLPEAGLPSSLSHLIISDCDKLIASRKNWHLKSLPNLRVFYIKGRNEDVESFPEQGLLPTSITCLIISKFPCLKSLDKKGLQQLTSLELLSVDALPDLQLIAGDVFPASLKHLCISSCAEWQTISEEGLPISLERLIILNCPKLQIMPEKVIPASLIHLRIEDCPALQTMPKEGLPTSLQELIIQGCPLLANKCEREKGEYWNKISHIYRIEIDYEIVS